jgi:hypothetical protein
MTLPADAQQIDATDVGWMPDELLDELRHAGLPPGLVTSPACRRQPDDCCEIDAADHPPAPEPNVREATLAGSAIVQGDELVRRRPADP